MGWKDLKSDIEEEFNVLYDILCDSGAEPQTRDSKIGFNRKPNNNSARALKVVRDVCPFCGQILTMRVERKRGQPRRILPPEPHDCKWNAKGK